MNSKIEEISQDDKYILIEDLKKDPIFFKYIERQLDQARKETREDIAKNMIMTCPNHTLWEHNKYLVSQVTEVPLEEVERFHELFFGK